MKMNTVAPTTKAVFEKIELTPNHAHISFMDEIEPDQES